MNFTVYILFSESKNKFYIGFTSNLEDKIIRHNQKSKGLQEM
ncbi:GIY-YIG nuclease family protein [Flavobacterium piscisymbiosum]|uniref:GIY-YIG nuclease family protein n=1 Tax=Flavobacterium piscisymbiosum TaxID=2893753 RepID=A0ABS8MI79_9FLAO|nr:GIY-YIG nuclease family protein [Flavobacterium sp. F-30]MCC9065201.1 GIY-YIG nuclease family protein [Flavobacterium sp. F-30]